MSRYNPKFEIGDIVQVVSKKSKHNRMFGIFKGYTNGSNDDMCRIEIGYDIIFLMETSIKLITEKNIADLHCFEECKLMEEHNMLKNENVIVQLPKGVKDSDDFIKAFPCFKHLFKRKSNVALSFIRAVISHNMKLI